MRYVLAIMPYMPINLECNLNVTSKKGGVVANMPIITYPVCNKKNGVCFGNYATYGN